MPHALRSRLDDFARSEVDDGQWPGDACKPLPLVGGVGEE
ncbi:hypothetical protein ABIA18_004539 [Sinorhizobium fredii]